MKKDNRQSEITQSDWAFFSKAVFLLGRQCAALSLSDQAKGMVDLSIKALGRKTIKHRVFLFLVAVFGWANASKIIERVGR